MRESANGQASGWRTKAQNPLKLIAAVLTIAAVIRELRLPKEDRTWHGAVAGFVPYDFRRPTLDKLKQTFWDPSGPIVVSRAFGVGWTVNIGAVVDRVRSLATAR